MIEYKLKTDYDLRTNNCTTISIAAIEAMEAQTQTTLPGIEKIHGENDPRDLFKEVDRIFPKSNVINYDQKPQP